MPSLNALAIVIPRGRQVEGTLVVVHDRFHQRGLRVVVEEGAGARDADQPGGVEQAGCFRGPEADHRGRFQCCSRSRRRCRCRRRGSHSRDRWFPGFGIDMKSGPVAGTECARAGPEWHAKQRAFPVRPKNRSCPRATAAASPGLAARWFAICPLRSGSPSPSPSDGRPDSGEYDRVLERFHRLQLE